MSSCERSLQNKPHLPLAPGLPTSAMTLHLLPSPPAQRSSGQGHGSERSPNSKTFNAARSRPRAEGQGVASETDKCLRILRSGEPGEGGAIAGSALAHGAMPVSAPALGPPKSRQCSRKAGEVRASRAMREMNPISSPLAEQVSTSQADPIPFPYSLRRGWER